MNRIRAVVVDDEPPARKRIAELLAREPDVVLEGEYGKAAEALRAILESVPDLLFVDVQMPEIDGFALLDRVEAATSDGRAPVTIFVTAYDHYALKAFEVRALDYLLKPFSDERFESALARARERILAKEKEELGERVLALAEGRPPARSSFLDRIVVRNAGRVSFVDVGDIDWIEAAGVYATLHEGSREHLLREPLRALETRLDPGKFGRIHRSAIVALDRVRELRHDERGNCHVVLRDGTSLRLSRNYRESFERRME